MFYFAAPILQNNSSSSKYYSKESQNMAISVKYQEVPQLLQHLNTLHLKMRSSCVCFYRQLLLGFFSFCFVCNMTVWIILGVWAGKCVCAGRRRRFTPAASLLAVDTVTDCLHVVWRVCVRASTTGRCEKHASGDRGGGGEMMRVSVRCLSQRTGPHCRTALMYPHTQTNRFLGRFLNRNIYIYIFNFLVSFLAIKRKTWPIRRIRRV